MRVASRAPTGAGALHLLGLSPAWRGKFSRRWLDKTLDGWNPDLVYSFAFSRETLDTRIGSQNPWDPLHRTHRGRWN